MIYFDYSFQVWMNSSIVKRRVLSKKKATALISIPTRVAVPLNPIEAGGKILVSSFRRGNVFANSRRDSERCATLSSGKIF